MNERKASHLERYFELCEQEPELFDNPKGTIVKIVTDPSELRAVEEEQRSRLSKSATPLDWATVGVVFRDQYIEVIRDGVEFPDCTRGTYIRVLNRRRGIAGAAILPILAEKIVLLRHFRHATRSWHLEIPRGFAEATESPEQTAARELTEEVGVPPTSLTRLGDIHPDTGLLNARVAIFAATVESLQVAGKGEGIDNVKIVSVKELEQMIIAGDVTDAFTLAAVSMAHACGALPNDNAGQAT